MKSTCDARPQCNTGNTIKGETSAVLSGLMRYEAVLQDRMHRGCHISMQTSVDISAAALYIDFFEITPILLSHYFLLIISKIMIISKINKNSFILHIYRLIKSTKRAQISTKALFIR